MNYDTIYVYVLLDHLGELRYVGITVDPKTRFAMHCSDPSNSHKANWIRKLKRQGNRPYMQIIQEVSYAYGLKVEAYWIEFFLKQGCRLTNTQSGGSGWLQPYPEEAKAVMSQKAKNRWANEEERKKQAQRIKGQKHSPETIEKRANSNRGKKRTPEQLITHSNINKGRIFGSEARKNMSEAAKKRRFSEEVKAKRRLSGPNRVRIVDQNGTIYESKREARLKTGVHNQKIDKILNGKLESYKGWKFSYVK